METETRVEVPGGWEKGEQGVNVNQYRVSVWADEKVLEVDSGDICTIL